MKFNLDNEADRINYKAKSNELLFKRCNVELKQGITFVFYFYIR